MTRGLKVTLAYIHIPEVLDCQWEKPHLKPRMQELLGIGAERQMSYISRTTYKLYALPSRIQIREPPQLRLYSRRVSI